LVHKRKVGIKGIIYLIYIDKKLQIFIYKYHVKEYFLIVPFIFKLIFML